jgi:hypothetical protein
MQKALAYLSIVLIPLAGCTDSAMPTGATPAAVLGTSTSDSGGTVSGNAQGGRPGSSGVIYVISQGLYFDTFVAVDPLPMEGPFQLLADGQTQFGPGDPGYLGGRWWEDSNGNGSQDPDDHFFLCPLLPPGRPTP